MTKMPALRLHILCGGGGGLHPQCVQSTAAAVLLPVSAVLSVAPFDA